MASIVGIWPRFIEPELLYINRHTLTSPRFPDLKIVQISDIHLHTQVSDAFLKKIYRHLHAIKPDIIVFCGDFLCYGEMQDEKRIGQFLKELNAPLGSFAVLGNHDYEKRIALSEDGSYTLANQENSEIISGFQRLLSPIKPTGKVACELKDLKPHPKLLELIENSNVKLLNNETFPINQLINICGLGEHMTGQCDTKKALQNYNPNLPGIILCHNPDSLPAVSKMPGDVVLCGHTHGAQVNLPFIRHRLMLQEHPKWTRGIHTINDKWVYINRGLGSTMPFRWFSPPEMMVLTLKSE